MRYILAVGVLLLSMVRVARADDYEIKTVPYKDGAYALEGKTVSKGNPTGKPVVLLFPDWMGPSEVSLDAAKKVADAGYTAFIADVYGKDIRPTAVKEAAEQSSKYKADRPLMRHRAQAALEAASTLEGIDKAKIAAIGFCFGGTVALELARSGAPILGVVSFHGGLETPDSSLAKNIKGKILALHGAEDPLVPEKDVAAFENEMRNAKVDWELVKYGGAVHAFTNKGADALHVPGVAYNASADRRAFLAMDAFLSEIF